MILYEIIYNHVCVKGCSGILLYFPTGKYKRYSGKPDPQGNAQITNLKLTHKKTSDIEGFKFSYKKLVAVNHR